INAKLLAGKALAFKNTMVAVAGDPGQRDCVVLIHLTHLSPLSQIPTLGLPGLRELIGPGGLTGLQQPELRRDVPPVRRAAPHQLVPHPMIPELRARAHTRPPRQPSTR